MKIPLSWLQEYLSVELKAAELVDLLTFSGVEVEGVETVGGGLDALVVGEVLAVERHPDAERLVVCRVNDGKADCQVVCGAPNVKAGQKAAFAPVGAVLPDGTRLKKARLRGVESHGMLCAEDELGLSDSHEGIMVLDAAIPAGTPLTDVLGAPETVLDLEITWNRPDLLCVLGIARELAALYDVPFKLPEPVFAESDVPVESLTSVDLQDPDGCPRYTARVIDGVSIGPSPAWMQRRLTLCGVRPINNVVDITNYVMLECGHPLHAFDYYRLEEHRIVVRRAAQGECITTLDDQSRTLNEEMTVIADASRAVAVGGVMGGANSEICNETARVLLESATFDPARIHRTAVTLNMNTESSRRYERQVNPETVEWASRRAAMLLQDLAGGKAARGVIDCYPAPVGSRKVPFRFERARKLLGFHMDDAEMTGFLNRLGLNVGDVDKSICMVDVPSFRPDIEREADLIEEVARMHGLEGVPENDPACRLSGTLNDHLFQRREALRADLAGLGLTEVMHYSFIAEAQLDLCGIPAGGRLVLPNPVSAEHSVMRPSLIPQMIECLGHNRSRQVAAAALFEMGTVFHCRQDGSAGESTKLCLGMMGAVGRCGPDGKRPPSDEEVFLWLKGVLEAIGGRYAAGMVFRWEQGQVPWAAVGCGVDIFLDNRQVGSIGLISNSLRHKWRMNDPVAVAEIDLNVLLHVEAAKPAVKLPPVYPAVGRDVAFIAPLSVKHADVIRVIRANAPIELTSVELFDIFFGKGISDGMKSMAYSLEYRSLERTLTDEEANRLHEAVKQVLKNELNVELR